MLQASERATLELRARMYLKSLEIYYITRELGLIFDDKDDRGEYYMFPNACDHFKIKFRICVDL